MTGCANINITTQLNSFFSYLSDNKKASINTIQAYTRDLEKFTEYASANNISDFRCVDSDVIADFKTSLTSKGLSSSRMLIGSHCKAPAGLRSKPHS